MTQGYVRHADGRFTELGVLPGHTYCKPLHINNTGQIVGHVFNTPSDPSADTNVGRPFLWHNGLMTDLGLSSDASRALCVNESGQIVGAWEGRAFLWEDATVTDLNNLLPADSEWVLEVATAINNVGQIAGQGLFRGQARGFLLTLCGN